jgi:hypothetical protein
MAVPGRISAAPGGPAELLAEEFFHPRNYYRPGIGNRAYAASNSTHLESAKGEAAMADILEKELAEIERLLPGFARFEHRANNTFCGPIEAGFLG